MKRSSERILTTDVGSLPRPPDLLDMITAKQRGENVDAQRFAGRVKSAVAEVVGKQAASGIDVVNDVEMGRFGFIPYVNERLAGIEPRPNPSGEGTRARSREHLAFPEYDAWAAQMPGAAGRAPPTRWVCTGLIAYKGHQALARDIANLKSALAAVQCAEAFMPAVSPAGMILVPGIVTHASNLVEHPELVAQRIARFAAVVGCENVIAGADCGFASFSTSCEVHPTVVWAKLAALSEGARLASRALWS